MINQSRAQGTQPDRRPRPESRPPLTGTLSSDGERQAQGDEGPATTRTNTEATTSAVLVSLVCIGAGEPGFVIDIVRVIPK